MYEKSISNQIKKLKGLKNKKVLLQLPEGLWIYLDKILQELKNKEVKEIVWYKGRSFGACDLPIEEAKRINADVIIHVAHSPFLKTSAIQGIQIAYIEIFVDYDENYVVETIRNHNIKNAVIVGHLPYVHKFPSIVKKAKEKGINIELKKHDFLPHKGQILGCNIANASTNKEVIIYVGDGIFHLQGLYELKKEILAIDPVSKTTRLIKKEELKKEERKKIATYALIQNAKKLGIIISSKIGQYEVFAKPVKEMVKKEFKNKKLLWIIENEIKKEELEFLKVDAFINLACPRLEDDTFPKPILSWKTYVRIKALLS